MAVEEVYVVLDKAPGPDSAKLVEVETANGAGVRVGGALDERGYWRIGPLYLRTGEITTELSAEIQVAARVAANELIEVNRMHEVEEHGGEPCVENRAGLVAFVAHSLGLTAGNLGVVADALSRYGEHHDGHAHG